MHRYRTIEPTLHSKTRIEEVELSKTGQLEVIVSHMSKLILPLMNLLLI